jgi:hypothetical protein
MATVTLKNTTGANVTIPDLGIIIPASGQDSFTDLIMQMKICQSRNLRTLVAAGTLVINDGTEDLNLLDAQRYLNYDMGKESLCQSYLRAVGPFSLSDQAEISLYFGPIGTFETLQVLGPTFRETPANVKGIINAKDLASTPAGMLGWCLEKNAAGNWFIHFSNNLGLDVTIDFAVFRIIPAT